MIDAEPDLDCHNSWDLTDFFEEQRCYIQILV